MKMKMKMATAIARHGHPTTSSWFNRKIVDPLLQILQRGAEPKKLAFSAALGITLGLFPICVRIGLEGLASLREILTFINTGVTVFLCGLAIAFLPSFCHAPTLMLANFIATPLEFSLVVPFLRFGEAISGGPRFPFTPDAFKKIFTGQASHGLLLSIAHVLLGWLVAAPFILVIGYLLFLPCFKILVCKFASNSKKSHHSHSEVSLKVRDA